MLSKTPQNLAKYLFAFRELSENEVLESHSSVQSSFWRIMLNNVEMLEY